MSNFLAIGTVTAALTQLLQSALDVDVPGASVSAIRPDRVDPSATGVNVYLYQVSPNSAWRSSDLPTRNSSGQPVQKPRIGLDLHYLMTFYGDESTLTTQRLYGSVIRTLHAKPVLTSAMITNGISSYPDLSSSNLADEVERVKLTLMPLSLEELSKLWSVFFQTAYNLSLAYQASVVLLETDVSTRRALPVLERSITASTFKQPVLEKAYALDGEDQAIVMGTVLVLRGQRLRQQGASVWVGSAELTPDSVRDTEIQVTLSGADLRAGVQGVQIVYESGATSNTLPLVLRPTATPGTATSSTVPVTLSPTVGSAQRVVLRLNEREPVDPEAPLAYSFAAPARTADTTAITFSIDDVTPGDYLVRVQVDGAESPLAVDPDNSHSTYNMYWTPKVTIP